MTETNGKKKGFGIRDCALAAIATGRRAQNLRELVSILSEIHPGCIYYHFWGGQLRPTFTQREYNNDFAQWAHNCMRDNVLAERLSVIDPTDFPDLEDLRQELMGVMEERMDELDHVPWSRQDQQFEFMRSQIVVFATNQTITQPEDLAGIIPKITISSVFYHFIDARRRTEGRVDDFRAWLAGWGPQYDDLCGLLAEIDPYFESLPDLRARLSDVFQSFFGGQSS